MKWLAQQIGKPNGIGFALRVFFICIGLVVLSVYWACNLIHQQFCTHPSFYSYPEDDSIACEKCGKEIWTPWGT